MWQRLFTPIPCDRRCRVRVYLSWAALLALFLIAAGVVKVAKENAWRGLDDRQFAFLLMSALAIGWPLIVLSSCRSFAAYRVWRQSNRPSPGGVFRSFGPSNYRGKPTSFEQHLAITLFAACAMMVIGGVFLAIALT
jgi:hypothetical protein